MKIQVLALPLAMASSVCFAHHSFNATFDPGEVIEIEGEVTRVIWRNPHVRFDVRVADDEEIWNVETHSVSILGRMQVDADILEIGDRIRIAGNPARRAENRIFAVNVMLASGQEVVLDPREGPRWAEQSIESMDYWVSPDTLAGEGSSIYRVWSSVLTDPKSFPLFPHGFVPTFEIASYGLTESASQAVADFDPYADSPTLGCDPKGMPTIMEQPYPLEFTAQGDQILIRIEEYDTVRTVHMAADAVDENVPRSLLGHSTGRWYGSALVVRTDRIDWPYFDTVGVPLSEEAVVIERFTPGADGTRLDYRIQVADPKTFTEPIVFEKYWLAVPGTMVEPYRCVN